MWVTVLKKRLSLRKQLLIILLAFIVLILGIIYFFQTNFLDDFYRKSKENTLEQVADNIAYSLYEEDTNSYFESVGLSNEVCVRIVSNNNKYNNPGACILRSVDSNTINSIYRDVENNNGSKMFYNFVSYDGFPIAREVKDMLVYGKSININDSPVLILVSSIITPLNATISTIKSQYFIIALIVVVATIILALIISRLMIRPIKKINDESKNLSKGKYIGEDIKCINKEYDELNRTLIEANEDILKADKAKKELLANVSHDLRTPLTMIEGYGEMIRDIEEENNEENINVIIDEAKRLSYLVDDLIDISRIENSKLVLHKSKISLYELVSDVYRQYEKYCESQNVFFKLDAQTSLQDVYVEVDVNRIKQVLYNFINNALNYNDKDNQEIVLGVEDNDGLYRVFVKDNGRGIKQEDVDNIWDRYYKVDKTHVRNHIGSGIGLSLCKELLEAHELNYGVESVLDEYSTFYFEIKACN